MVDIFITIADKDIELVRKKYMISFKDTIFPFIKICTICKLNIEFCSLSHQIYKFLQLEI